MSRQLLTLLTNLPFRSSPTFSADADALWPQINQLATEMNNFDFIMPRLTILTGSGTYPTPDGCQLLILKGKAGGGAGGGVDGVGAGNAAAGGGGGEGGYFEHWILNPSGVWTYSVGLGGAPGPAGGNDGSDGTDTTFTNGDDVVLFAGGGKGGLARLASASTQAAAAGGDGGDATGADLCVPGARGRSGVVGQGFIFGPGHGAGSGPWGRDSVLNALSGSTGAGDGVNGAGYGSGGSGAQVAGVSNDRAGGAGAPGRLEIVEVY